MSKMSYVKNDKNVQNCQGKRKMLIMLDNPKTSKAKCKNGKKMHLRLCI